MGAVVVFVIASMAGTLPFGVSLPRNTEHAVGVCMPSWADVIDYEEGRKNPSAGYPRFVFMEPVRELFALAKSLFAARGEAAMAMPSARASARGHQPQQRHHGAPRRPQKA